MDVSLDGKRYFQTPLQFQLYDLKILGLSLREVDRDNCLNTFFKPLNSKMTATGLALKDYRCRQWLNVIIWRGNRYVDKKDRNILGENKASEQTSRSLLQIW